MTQQEVLTAVDNGEDALRSKLAQAESDALTLALRLYGESDDTFSPETLEVMTRYRPKCDTLLRSAQQIERRP
jgi:hypothetical protein